MLNWLTKDTVADAGARLDQNIVHASRELAGNVDRIGTHLDQTVEKAEAGVKTSIESASLELEKNIKLLSAEITAHRAATKADIAQLIDYAAERLDKTIQHRMTEIRNQTSLLIDEKVAAIRASLAEAAEEQKQAFLRNASVAVGSAIVVALISVAAKKLSNTPYDALTIFRIVLGMFAAGGAASLAYRLFLRYKSRSRTERDVIKLVLHDVRILNPKGVALHVTILAATLALWLLLLLAPRVFGL